MQAQLTGKPEATTPFYQQQKTKDGVGDATLDQQDFLNLLVTQLQNQDPINPTDNAEFMSQTTAFSQLNEMTTMNASINKMVEMLTLQAYNNNSLTAGANFIGKEIEYQTNTVTIGGDSLPNFSFYCGGDAVAENSYINVYNEEDVLVATVKPEKLQNGQNTIRWDGTGEGGVKVPDGTYYFEVHANNAKGESIPIQEFSTGKVVGVKMSGGKLFFDIGNGVVSSEYVYSVKDPNIKPSDPSKPEGNKPEDNKPEDNKPEGNKPETDTKPENKPETDKPNGNGNGNGSDTSKPETDKPSGENKPSGKFFYRYGL